MNIVFKGISKKDIYLNCLFSSIAHAVMVGNYPDLASEQSWDSNNYSFQNLEGGRGTMSFSDNHFVAVVQNEVDYKTYNENILATHFQGANSQIVELAENEALQYVLDHCGAKILPVISSAFWGNNTIYSNSDEDFILHNANSMLRPLIRIFDIEALSSFWCEYYDMNTEHLLLVKSIFSRRQNKDELMITEEEKRLICEWFDCIDDCIESFAEMKIYFPE